MHQCLFQRLKREQLYKLCKSQGEWSAVTLSPSFFDICHLPCIFLAEQDIKITFSLGPKIGWYKINADCISTAGSPEPLPAALFISRSHCKFCHARQFPEGFITWVFKRDSLILELLEVCFLSIQVMRRESNFSRSLAVHRECVVWTLFYLWKQTSCVPALLTRRPPLTATVSAAKQHSTAEQTKPALWLRGCTEGLTPKRLYTRLCRPKAGRSPVGKQWMYNVVFYFKKQMLFYKLGNKDWMT